MTAVSTISAVSALAASSKVKGYDKKLRVRATIKDIYVNHTGLYNSVDQAIPNAIYMKVDDSGPGTNNVTITMKLPLTGDVVAGNDRLMGNEVEAETKHGTIYRNNWKFAVKTEKFNTRKLDQQDYGLFEEHIGELATWARQFTGMEIRQALLRRYPDSMTAGTSNDLSGVISNEWNPNFWMQGTSDANQPTYNSNANAYINSIGHAILSSGDTNSYAPENAGAPTFRMLNRLAMAALNKKLMPLSIDGRDAYILTMSELGATIFTDPNWTNSMGALWVQYDRLSEKQQNWYGVLGRFKSTIGCDIYVTVDPKLPRILPSGSAGVSLTPSYMAPGDTDNRSSSANARDANMLLGKGALVEWEPEKMHFISQEDDYKRLAGNGIAGTRGIQALYFDQESPAATSKEYYGSMVVLTDRVSYS